MPPDPARRREELDELGALEPVHEPRYDAVADLAAQLCQAPMALVNLLGADDQHVKGRAGRPASGIERLPFCPHAVTGPQVLEVHDALADPRFRDDPVVVGEPHARFYAGAPVVGSRGQALGTVCVLDQRPRRLTAGQRRALAELADYAADLLRLRHYAGLSGQAARQLQDAEELKQRFLRTVNHELRTPLTAISSYLQLIQDGDLDEATEQEFLGVIERNSDRILHLIDELLLLSSLTARTAPFHPARVDLTELARHAVVDALGKAWNNSVTLTLHSRNEVTAWADARRVDQALTQLLDNAIKFTPSGGAVDVTVLDRPAPTVEIRDTGIGIGADDLPHVFEDFYRAPEAEENAIGGTGVGLAIVKEVIRMNRGDVRIESEPGDGVHVRLVLPSPPPDSP
ncbi:GAF domain-containing sensor histidine kinase [Planomonospora sp. ID67723]|uniref:sensor histidine kinase n=1 Tax=Planomonospora sp. ID67723 TaxID=2738134 RepID=UPI0018C39F7D|nr:GAF domain-containing sensor histidine kinase [Planomonospora sp. ID67723]MBG0828629.1 GAF domain-containing sensor histidine kinase [Planomonospora sp. ID67723]